LRPTKGYTNDIYGHSTAESVTPAGRPTQPIWTRTTCTTAFRWWSIQPSSIRLKPDWSWLTAGAL